MLSGLKNAVGLKLIGSNMRGYKRKRSKFRGWDIRLNGRYWIFCDDGQPVPNAWYKKPCGHCLKPRTKEGHDGCLGTLEGVRNACCGHGVVNEAYVQFLDDSWIGGDDALALFRQVKKDKQ